MHVVKIIHSSFLKAQVHLLSLLAQLQETTPNEISLILLGSPYTCL